MKIRIIAKPNHNGEILWEDDLKFFNPVEVICPIDGKTLNLFQKDWEQFLNRLLSSSPSISEFKDKLLKKSTSLEQMLFGNRKLPWKQQGFKDHIFLQTDPEFTAYPWEILTSNGSFFFEKKNFYRGIRSNHHLTDTKSGKTFLLVENPVLESLVESVKSEGKQISNLVEDNSKFPFLRLKSENLKISRFWDEISNAGFLHYAGHTDKGQIPFPKEEMFLGDQIGQAKLTNLQIVFLNSCHSAFEGESTSGLSSQFLKSGTKYVLDFLNPIETGVAEKIGVQFWETYFRVGNARTAFQTVKSQLQKGDVKEYASSLSFICFSPDEKKKSQALLSTLIVCSLLLLSLSLITFFNQKNKIENQAPVPQETEPNPKKWNKEDPKPTSLREKIANLKDIEFKNQIQNFLKEDNPLLDKKQKMEILEEVFSTNGNEKLQYYHFKQLTGME